MTSLYYVTEHIKLVGKWFAIAIASIVLLIFLYRFFFFMKEALFPTPPPPPTVTWKKLPTLSFPESRYAQEFEYEINTLSGTFPKLPDRLNVNLIATPQASLQSLRNAQEVIQSAGFNSEDIRISESVYQWMNTEPPQQKIQYDIVSKNFMLTSNYLNDEGVLSGESLPDDVDSQVAAENFLANFDAFPGDFDATRSAITFYAITDGVLETTTSLSNAQVIRVDFFQRDLHNLPIYYPQYPQTPTYVIIGGGSSGSNVVEAQYMHHTITDVSSTYPIKSADEAFAILKKGGGYIASYKGNGAKVLIQDVKLGYYIDETTNTYVMPIIIFIGNNDFIGYVSAIKDEWINK